MEIEELKRRLGLDGVTVPATATADEVKALAMAHWFTCPPGGPLPKGVAEDRLLQRIEAGLDKPQAIHVELQQLAHELGLTLEYAELHRQSLPPKEEPYIHRLGWFGSSNGETVRVAG